MSETPSNTLRLLDEAATILNETKKAYQEGSFESLEQRVFNPIFDINYEAEMQDVSQGDNRIRFTKTRLNTQDKEQLTHYLALYYRYEMSEDGFLNEKNWQAIDQLIYRIGETDLDIFGYLPKGYKILFCPNGKTLYNGSVDYQNKVIYILGDISSLGSIVTILHEVGHVKDNERLERIGRTELIEGGDLHQNTEAEKIRKEREASLFALRKLWRELRKNNQLKKDVLLYLKNMAYSSYCEEAFSRISSARAMTHGDPYDLELDMAEERERDWYDAWTKFRGSKEYQKWKNMKEFSDVDEFEEFGAWRDWTEKNGKADLSV